MLIHTPRHFLSRKCTFFVYFLAPVLVKIRYFWAIPSSVGMYSHVPSPVGRLVGVASVFHHPKGCTRCAIHHPPSFFEPNMHIFPPFLAPFLATICYFWPYSVTRRGVYHSREAAEWSATVGSAERSGFPPPSPEGVYQKQCAGGRKPP